MEQILKKNILELFLDKLMGFPLWVKQIIYLRLHQNLTQSLSDDFITTQENDLFHLYVPTLSFIGKTELAERKGNHDPNMYTFLTNIESGLNMVEISMNNFWTMEEVAKYYVSCLESDFLKPGATNLINSTAGFMSGKLRIGEYFKRIGKINVDQLEQTIVKQKEYTNQGNPMKMAEVMISMGLITEKDVHSLLILKEESQKRFILDASIIPAYANEQKPSEQPSANVEEYKAQIAKLTEQNNQLKEQLKRILAFVKKHG